MSAAQNPTAKIVHGIKKEIEGYLVGGDPLTEWILTAYLAGGHILLEGPPGTGKTTSARLVSRYLSRSFKRVQFTTDLLPSDILGAHLYDPERRQFDFVAGPIFCDLLLADEINRAPPRTQSALLEAMEERQVTLEGTTRALPAEFFVIATQNPFDHEGTFPLPETQLDRFLMKVNLRHAPAASESETIARVLSGQLPPKYSEIQPLAYDHHAVQEDLQRVRFEPSILAYIARLLEATRTSPMIATGSGLRGGLAIARCARVLARLDDRDFVTADDVKRLAPACLQHRIRISAEAQVSGATEEALILELLEKTEFPK